MTEFDLNSELQRLQEDGEAYYVRSEFSTADVDTKELKSRMTAIVDALEENEACIATSDVFNSIRGFIKGFQGLLPNMRHLVVATILSGIEKCTTSLRTALLQETAFDFEADRKVVERWVFLLHWIINTAETIKGRSKTSGSSRSSDQWDWNHDKSSLLVGLRGLLSLPLERMFHIATELEIFISAVTKPCYQLLETKENLKTIPVRSGLFDVLAICVQKYQHGFAAQTSIIQMLPYFEHLPEPMAEFVAHVAIKFDTPSLLDDILMDISKLHFSAQDSANSKCISAFLVRLTESAPRLVNKKISVLIKHIDSESYTMRMALIEVVGHLILTNNVAATPKPASPAKKTRKQVDSDNEEEDEEDDEEDKDKEEERESGTNHEATVNSLFEVLEERAADSNAFVRTRLLQTLLLLSESKAVPITLRDRLLLLCLERLHDKSSAVRRRALQLLTGFVTSHPFRMDGGQLTTAVIKGKLLEIENMIKNKMNLNTADVDTETKEQEEKDDDEEEEQTNKQTVSTIDAETARQLGLLQIQRRYYQDATTFLERLNSAQGVLRQLMVSNYKTDVIETVIYFTTASEFGIDGAQEGVRDMLHLVWSKDDISAPTETAPNKGDDAEPKEMKDRTIKDHVISAYQSLFLTEDPELPSKERSQKIARNLFNLTKDLTLAQLTSLDELIFLMMKKNLIDSELLKTLWHYYGTKSDIPKTHRRGAILLLSMLARAQPQIIAEKVDLLMAVGLSNSEKVDPMLCLYTCTALQRLNPRQRGAKAKAVGHETGFNRVEPDHQLCKKLAQIIMNGDMPYDQWLPVAEQALECLYLLSEQPDRTAAEIIRHYTALCFNLSSSSSANEDNASVPASSDELTVSSWTLARLLFVVGHVAVKQIAHLEEIERQWKQRKASKEKEKEKEKDKEKEKETPRKANQAIANELDHVAGSVTAEDEFSELVQQVRENELLFGSESLLGVYGPIAASICAGTKTYEDDVVQAAAVLCLCKLMCVSAEFCEENLQLLLTLLEKSPSEIIRSNIVIALGDMAICFSSLIDENITHVYKRLRDPSIFVRKNALMVLSHLILNGMVKVKGQIAELAKCLDEPDSRISELAKLFFAEMGSKDNAIYNNLPDIISGLSAGEHPLDEAAFKRVINYIFSFIQKDKQTESLVEKLCNRFRQSENERQWRDVSFCLSRLSYSSEKALKKLTEGFCNYQDKLCDDQIYQNFCDILTKARKFQKAELKQNLDEFELKLQEFHAKGKGEVVSSTSRSSNSTSSKAKSVENKENKENVPRQAPSKQKKAPKATKAKARRVVEASDDDDDDDFDVAKLIKR